MASAFARRIEEAILVDEVGLEFGRHGDVVLKAAYQPLFAASGGKLRFRAAKGLTRPSRLGRPLPAARFFEGLASNTRWQVEALCAALQIRNLNQVDHDGLLLFVGLGAGPPTGSCVDFLAEEADRAGFERSRLAIEIDARAVDGACWPAFWEAIRQSGFAIAISGYGLGEDADRLLDLVPGFVRLDGAFFRRAARSAEAMRLLGLMVERLHGRGVKVVLGGIETRSELEAALGAGADLLRGHLLAHPALAGAIFEPSPAFPAGTAYSGDNVVRFG